MHCTETNRSANRIESSHTVWMGCTEHVLQAAFQPRTTLLQCYPAFKGGKALLNSIIRYSEHQCFHMTRSCRARSYTSLLPHLRCVRLQEKCKKPEKNVFQLSVCDDNLWMQNRSRRTFMRMGVRQRNKELC